MDPLLPELPSPESPQSSSYSVQPARVRASKACTRCRRYRKKCQAGPSTQQGKPPCQSCIDAEAAETCEFRNRGFSYEDRKHRRRPTLPAQHGHFSPEPLPKAILDDSQDLSRPLSQPSASMQEAPCNLPPSEEVIEAVNQYISSYFQVGFMHKAVFIDRYTRYPDSIPTFLLLAVCSLAAPYAPSLVKRYGGKKEATQHFLQVAGESIGQEMLVPTLERTQAFLLLGVAAWGQGDGQKAWMLIGTAVRMAGFLALHREATFRLPPNPEPEDVIQAEVARRTFWSIVCHESLLAGQNRPCQIPLGEIDVRLPSSESDFNFGIEPASKSTIAGALGTVTSNGSRDSSKSLFSSLIEISLLWSWTARHVCRGPQDHPEQPWSMSTQSLLKALDDFEAGLPPRHRFNTSNLRGMIMESHDLPFVTLGLMHKLSNIVIRRMYLSAMAAAVDRETAPVMSAEDQMFWQHMASEMVRNAEDLLSQVETYFSLKSPANGFPPILLFSVFITGNVFSYLCRWPELCPPRAMMAGASFQRCKDILLQVSDSWPLAAQWHKALEAPRRQSQNPLRTAITDERTLDEELGGLYGAQVTKENKARIFHPTPDVSSNSAVQFDFGTSNAGQIQPFPAAPSGPAPPYSTGNQPDMSDFDAIQQIVDMGISFDTFNEDLSAFLMLGDEGM